MAVIMRIHKQFTSFRYQVIKVYITVEEWTVGPLHWSLCARAFRITHVISIFVASQLDFLANRNPELADGSQ